MQFTCVYFETNRIERQVEADSAEEAIKKADAEAVNGWEGCQEESLGTDGVVEVLDANNKRVWLDGEPVTDPELM